MSCAGAQLVRELSAAVAVVMANLPAAEGSIPPTAAVNLNIFIFRVLFVLFVQLVW